MQNLPKLPIGVQHFSVLKGENYLYIDKTEAVHQLANEGGAFFLSRPRRFGKSLFLHTLAELAHGRRELFNDTWIEDKWDWSRKYPVLHFQFASMSFHDMGLRPAILVVLKKMCVEHDIIPKTDDVKSIFGQLLQEISAKKGKLVLLVDEYDKPIITYLESHKMPIAIENQAIMKDFYGILKDNGDCTHLTMITGVSKFARVSLFSDLNHLQDLTLNNRFATTFGYTQTEVEVYFEPYIAKYLAETPDFTRERFLEKVKLWYNGYSWDSRTTVYNPFGLLNFFKTGQFQNFWFASGTPSFLQHLLLNKGQTNFENCMVSNTFLDQYDLENIQSASLLFQTGYLTIKDINPEDNTMTLDYPNLEVRESFYQFLITYLGQRETDSKITVRELNAAFRNNDLEEAYQILCEVFDALPYDVYKASNEALYHGLIHILFKYMGISIQSEVHTKRGRLDAVIQTGTHVYIFEFKFNKSSEAAIQQLQKRDYAAKFRHLDKQIVGIGLNFTEKDHALDEWIVLEL